MLKLLLPEAAAAQLARQYGRSHAAWLGQAPAMTLAQTPPQTSPLVSARWPLLLPLGQPTEADAAAQPEAVRAWVQAWLAWPPCCAGCWPTRDRACCCVSCRCRACTPSGSSSAMP